MRSVKALFFVKFDMCIKRVKEMYEDVVFLVEIWQSDVRKLSYKKMFSFFYRRDF